MAQRNDESDEIVAVSVDKILNENDSDEGLTFTVTKSTSHGFWQATLGLAQVNKLRGNFWKKFGFTINGINFLYPEEALFLYEKQQLVLSKHNDLSDQMNKQDTYDSALAALPLPAYLSYFKLKSLDYIPLRHKKIINVFKDDFELHQFLKSNPDTSLLDAMVAYDVYVENENFTKRVAKETPPASYIVITNGMSTFSGGILLTLLNEACGIPVIFAVVNPSGQVLLEEFTNAESSLQLRVNKDTYNSSKKRILEEVHIGESADSSASEGVTDEIVEATEGQSVAV